VRPLLYVASPLSDLPINYLEWLGLMNSEAEWAFEQGWAPLIPGNDLLFCYRSARKFTIEDLLEIDREYIRASWAIRVISEKHRDGRTSYGVGREIAMAGNFGVDICRTREETVLSYERWAKTLEA
jgi:hypothetical protein